MTITYAVSQFFGLAACILYLLIFLFFFHNAMIRLTRFKSKLSKAVSCTAFILFTGTLYTWMGYAGYGSSAFVAPSHVFVLGLIWAEYYRETKMARSKG